MTYFVLWGDIALAKEKSIHKLNLESFQKIRIVDDDLWDENAYQTIVKHMERGMSPKSAAAQAGIPSKTFKEWMQYDSFASVIDTIQAQIVGEIEATVYETLKAIPDENQKANTAIKHLERMKPEYGTKHIDIKDDGGEKVDIKIDGTIEDITKQANEHADRVPKQDS
jgi:hypothetical protein